MLKLSIKITDSRSDEYIIKNNEFLMTESSISKAGGIEFPIISESK